MRSVAFVLLRLVAFVAIAVLNAGGAIKGIQQGHSPYEIAINIVFAALMVGFALRIPEDS